MVYADWKTTAIRRKVVRETRDSSLWGAWLRAPWNPFDHHNTMVLGGFSLRENNPRLLRPSKCWGKCSTKHSYFTLTNILFLTYLTSKYFLLYIIFNYRLSSIYFPTVFGNKNLYKKVPSNFHLNKILTIFLFMLTNNFSEENDINFTLIHKNV